MESMPATVAQETTPAAFDVAGFLRKGQERFDAAEARLPERPALDITYGKIGDRWGYVITMPEGALIDITIRTPSVPGETKCGQRIIGDGMEAAYISWDTSTGATRPQDVGVSQGRSHGATVG